MNPINMIPRFKFVDLPLYFYYVLYIGGAGAKRILGRIFCGVLSGRSFISIIKVSFHIFDFVLDFIVYDKLFGNGVTVASQSIWRLFNCSFCTVF